jgi:hypothetical protein
MISIAEVRSMIMALEGVAAAPHVDREAFRAGGRVFATLRSDGLLNVLLSPEEQEMRCEAAPHVFRPVEGGWGRMGFTTVDLAAADVADVQSALLAAWNASKPRPRKRQKH